MPLLSRLAVQSDKAYGFFSNVSYTASYLIVAGGGGGGSGIVSNGLGGGCLLYTSPSPRD